MAEQYDASDAQQVRKRERESRNAAKEQDEMLYAIMDLHQGRKWMWRFLETLHIFHTPFGSDANMSYFAGGEQNVGLRLMADLMRVCPNLYWKMTQENQSGRSSDNRDQAGRDSADDGDEADGNQTG